MFKLWITIVILQFLLTVGVVFADDKKIDFCKSQQKGSQIYYYNNCDELTYLYNGDPTNDDYWRLNNKKGYKNGTWSNIPEDANPNFDIMKHYVRKYALQSPYRPDSFYQFKIESTEVKTFEYNVVENKKVTKALNKTGLLSYIVYDNGTIVGDQITPKDRFGKYFTNKTNWSSHSMGKSIQSYILGHAVCKAYIGSIHEPIMWSILEGTAFEGQPLVNVLNMSTGINRYMRDDWSSKFKKSKRWVNSTSLESIMKNEMKESKSAKSAGSKYAYNNLNTNLFSSYVLHSMGIEAYENMLNEIFADKVGIENDVIFYKTRNAGDESSITYGMFITRMDFVRIAVAMLDDWNNNTCEGQYLKSLYDNKIKKKKEYRHNRFGFTNPKNYGGQFHWGLSGGKQDKPIAIMHGYGGQNIVIDFENNKIVSTLSIHQNWPWLSVVHSNF